MVAVTAGSLRAVVTIEMPSDASVTGMGVCPKEMRLWPKCELRAEEPSLYTSEALIDCCPFFWA